MNDDTSDLGPLPTREQFHRFLKKWAEEHGKEFIDVPLSPASLLFDEFATPEEIQTRCEINRAVLQLISSPPSNQ